jgi:predicted RNA-binding protein with RPS1 domain/DNA-binding response OmpR family regulator
MSCSILTRDSLDALLDGRLRGPALVAVRAHLAQPCDACLDLLEGEELNPFLERVCRGESERAWSELSEVQREFILHTAISGISIEILVADDDSAAADSVADLLRQERYACQTANSAEQALAVAAAPVLTIVNTNLVSRDGIRLVDAFRDRFPQTRVICISDNGTRDEAVEWLRRGAVDYLIKPCRRSNLVWAVERALAKRRIEFARTLAPTRYTHKWLATALEMAQGMQTEQNTRTTERRPLDMKQTEQNPWTLLEDKYPIGTQIKGPVRNVTDFGIFVGVEEGVDGLVYVTDISWTQRTKHPGEMFKEGDEVEAVVLDIDAENERLSLGIKQLQPDPWDTLSDRVSVGSRVKGKISRITASGAFVEIEPGVEGLVPVSDLPDWRVNNPADVVSEGQEVEVKVIEINWQERKMALSMKALFCEGWGDYKEYLRKQLDGARLGHVTRSKRKN